MITPMFPANIQRQMIPAMTTGMAQGMRMRTCNTLAPTNFSLSNMAINIPRMTSPTTITAVNCAVVLKERIRPGFFKTSTKFFMPVRGCRPGWRRSYLCKARSKLYKTGYIVKRTMIKMAGRMER